MRWSVSALPALAWLLSACEACPLGNRRHSVRDATPTNGNHTLWRRVRIGGGGSGDSAPTTSSLFSVGDGSTPGGCSGQTTTTDAWLNEALLLHQAVETAYDSTQSNPRLMLLWMSFFGIKFNNDGSPNTDDAVTEFLWPSIGNSIAAVSQFLSGGGLINNPGPGNPWIFCSEAAGEYTPFDQPIKDKDGDYAVTDYYLDEAGDVVPTEFLKLGQVYPAQASNSDINAFYMTAFSGYDFDTNGFQTLCGKPSLYAVTAWPQATPNQLVVDEAEIELAQEGRHVLFCPPSFTPGTGAPHSYPSLAQAVSSGNYPTGNQADLGTSKSMPLDKYMPVSATFYHELYHLTDSTGITFDPYYSLKDVLTAGKNQAGDTYRNPESFAFFALAAYMYLNPPSGAEAILFLGGLPYQASGFNRN
ncbi:hypothetical protein QBC46DRAFT_382650 [Diplogelasinospora grovesii]|uniref:Uncharacterized protein n=1 Tax=Diplogelasinospora grovesii TaxID=303347 RepID=A0AAN6N9R0_9PEZI|nr:hypothetical protein QBC46DRAFT_382650 [Diplogelasinospora grovesii]